MSSNVTSDRLPANDKCAMSERRQRPLRLELDRSSLPSATDLLNRSITVAEAASLLGCNPSTVRALLNAGQLAGHRVGKGANPRGIRVHVDSVNDYIARHAVGQIADNDNGAPAARRSSPRTAEHVAAVARLRAWGI